MLGCCARRNAVFPWKILLAQDLIVLGGLQNEKVALALAPALTIIFVLFGGFYANTNTIPK